MSDRAQALAAIVITEMASQRYSSEEVWLVSRAISDVRASTEEVIDSVCGALADAFCRRFSALDFQDKLRIRNAADGNDGLQELFDSLFGIVRHSQLFGNVPPLDPVGVQCRNLNRASALEADAHLQPLVDGNTIHSSSSSGAVGRVDTSASPEDASAPGSAAAA